MTLIAYQLHHAPTAIEGWLSLFDLAVVRAIAAPFVLYQVLRARNVPARNDLIPPNLISWTMAIALVLASFHFSELVVIAPGEERTLVAVATAGVLLGFLVLATQSGPFSQMIGALRIENAIALFELSSKRHESSVGVHLGVFAVFIATIVFFRWYLMTLGSNEPAGPEGPTL